MFLAATSRDLRPALAIFYCLQIVLGVLIHLGASRWPARVLAALGLMVVLCAGFALLVLLGPKAHDQPALAIALFMGMLGLFRLMGRSAG